MGDSWRQNPRFEFQRRSRQAPEIKTSYVTNADEKPEKQIADIDDLLVKGIDVLIVYPTVGDAIVPAIERAYSSGVPVIVFGGTIDTDSYTCLVKTQDDEFGCAQARWLAEELKKKGKIVMLSGIAGNTTCEDRLAGAREEFKKYPGIEILDHQYCDWFPQRRKGIMETMIQAFPKIDGIWADSGLDVVARAPGHEGSRAAARPLDRRPAERVREIPLVENKVRGYVYPMTESSPGRLS